ncbi:MAG: hypothetical protein COA78_20810 [Blastopirellula sp.]|nr:MAG: hypothetical protein COA78_20810 [Blastopirellula sp.]
MEQSMLNSLWVLVCVALVFAMQGGFLCLESGLTRSKDAIKNMTNNFLAVLLTWAYCLNLEFIDTALEHVQ